MHVYVLCRNGAKVGRREVSMRPPYFGDLRMTWHGPGRLGGVIARASLLDAKGCDQMQPLDVMLFRIKARGVLLSGEQMTFRSSSPKAKAWRSSQMWFAVSQPLPLAEEYEAWLAHLATLAGYTPPEGWA